MQIEKSLVIGIGGMAGNTLNNIFSKHGDEYPLLSINTEADSLEYALGGHKVLIGKSITKDKGAGGNIEVGKAAAEENLSEISPYIKKADTICLIAGLGGGTGGGAIPVIAKHAIELEKKVVCIVTMPFSFEGKERDIAAREALKALDNLGVEKRVYLNQDLFKLANDRTTFADAFKMLDDIIFEWIIEALNDTEKQVKKTVYQ